MTDISSDGRTVVGEGRNPAGENEAWLATLPMLVPEPGTLLLFALGITAMARHP